MSYWTLKSSACFQFHYKAPNRQLHLFLCYGSDSKNGQNTVYKLWEFQSVTALMKYMFPEDTRNSYYL